MTSWLPFDWFSDTEGNHIVELWLLTKEGTELVVRNSMINVRAWAEATHVHVLDAPEYTVIEEISYHHPDGTVEKEYDDSGECYSTLEDADMAALDAAKYYLAHPDVFTWDGTSRTVDNYYVKENSRG
jgi:hypothetical protein